MSELTLPTDITIEDITRNPDVRMEASDLVLTALHTNLAGYGVDTFESSSSSDCDVVLGAMNLEKQVIGAIGYRARGYEDDIYVERLAVQAGYRRKGIGRELLARADNAGLLLGKKVLRLCASRGSRTYYTESLGFTCPNPKSSLQLERAIRSE